MYRRRARRGHRQVFAWPASATSSAPTRAEQTKHPLEKSHHDPSRILERPRVFVTGHTGFKGSWLCIWLHKLGAKVTGYALQPPSDPSLFELGRCAELIDHPWATSGIWRRCRRPCPPPKREIVIHMAAQSLVRYSYDNPIETFSTNVMGTANVLECARRDPAFAPWSA